MWDSNQNVFFILHRREGDKIEDGRSVAAKELIAASATHSDGLDKGDVLIFDNDVWKKDTKLWKRVQNTKWDDVILDQSLKDGLIRDVESFFDHRDEYKQFDVPWKRGIILHGLPGNGKTMSIRALMRGLASRPDPIPTLYVKWTKGDQGTIYAIRKIFKKARKMAPCLLIFEDLDSMITEDTRSFFLNEVDGLESNDGIMMIGSTNYLEKLDAGITKRPSRFDRKYHSTSPPLPNEHAIANTGGPDSQATKPSNVLPLYLQQSQVSRKASASPTSRKRSSRLFLLLSISSEAAPLTI